MTLKDNLGILHHQLRLTLFCSANKIVDKITLDTDLLLEGLVVHGLVRGKNRIKQL